MKRYGAQLNSEAVEYIEKALTSQQEHFKQEEASKK